MTSPICFVGRLCSSRCALPRFAQQLHRNKGSWQVSSHGRVRNSLGEVNYGVLHPSGYRQVKIHKQDYLVHRLVAAAFLGSPPSASCWQVNHRDGDPSNNAVCNLQYMTAAENMKHAWRTNLNRQPVAPKLGKAVQWRRQGEESWSVCASQSEAARLLDLPLSSVSRCCRGLQKKTRPHGGHEWYELRPARASKEGALLLDEDWRPATYVGDAVGTTIANLMVSSHGRISQLLHQREVISFGTPRKSGYYAVTKWRRFMFVHRLVAATFLGQPEYSHLEVNHKDFDGGNNHVTNLEYVSRSENMRHAFSRRVEREFKPKQGKRVQGRLKAVGGTWKDFDSITEAASQTGLSISQVSSLCCRPRNVAAWEFRVIPEESLLGEEWRQVSPELLQGARRRVLRSLSLDSPPSLQL